MKQPIKFSGRSGWENLAIILILLCMIAAVGKACKHFRMEQDYQRIEQLKNTTTL